MFREPSILQNCRHLKYFFEKPMKSKKYNHKGRLSFGPLLPLVVLNHSFEDN